MLIGHFSFCYNFKSLTNNSLLMSPIFLILYLLHNNVKLTQALANQCTAPAQTFLCGELWYLLVHKNLLCSRTSLRVPFHYCLSLTGFSLYPVKLCSHWNTEPVVWLQKRRNKLIPTLKWQRILLIDIAPAFILG